MNTEAIWLKLSLNSPEHLLEALTDLLGVLSGSGVEQRPVQEGFAWVTAFFALDSDRSEAQVTQEVTEEVEALFSLYQQPPPQLLVSHIKEEDWATSWQQFFTPCALVPGLVVKPSWEDYSPKAGEQVIEMDPGRAFGTGQHASTTLALTLIQRAFQHRRVDTVLDVGTGTGILALAAGRWDARTILAVDNDPEAVQAAQENVIRNDLHQQIRVSGEDISQIQTAPFDLVCANIIHEVLMVLAPDLVRLVGGQLVLAGILQGEQEEDLIQGYTRLGLHFQEAVYKEEWVALWFIRSRSVQP
jgi:ribosomal protein L11 methyltransferase